MRDIVKYEGTTLFRSERVETFNLAPGVKVGPMLGKHRMGANDQVGLYRNVIEPGCGIQREVHPETQETIIVISGTAKVMVQDKDPLGETAFALGPRPAGTVPAAHAIQLVQGDVLTIEPGTLHEVRNDARLVPFVFFCVASPPF